MKFYLIRHGMTKGNEEKRYVGGRTDIPLSERGIRELKGKQVPQAELVVVSPMIRCRQTAEIFYPDAHVYVEEGFRETDFGRFENKNYEELKDDIRYQEWLDSNGILPFPTGESHETVGMRVITGFERVRDYMKKHQIQTAAFVVHGGTIMHLMEEYGDGNFYEHQLANGAYVVLDENRRD